MAADVVMFTMDRHIDRRILQAATTLMAGGLSVRLFAPADRAPCNEPAWIQRVGARSPGPHGVGLRLYHRVRDHLPLLRRALRWLAWRIIREPERAFVALFSPILECAAARVYIAHDLPMLPVALSARRLHGGKVLFDSHELYPEQEFSAWEQQLWRQVEARNIGSADAVITVNTSIAREISRRHKVVVPTVVQNAEPYQRAPQAAGNRLRRTLGVPDSAPLFLYQGGLSANRNIEMLVAAFGCMRNESAMLAILGNGPLLPLLKRRVRSLGLTSRVHFHPAVSQSELLEMTREADFGVIPYQANCLNTELCTPNKLFEYIMARVPIVATDLPEIRRIVDGYDIGLLGATNAPEAFAHLIDEALDKQISSIQKWQTGLERAADNICWEREGEKYLSVVRELSTVGIKMMRS